MAVLLLHCYSPHERPEDQVATWEFIEKVRKERLGVKIVDVPCTSEGDYPRAWVRDLSATSVGWSSRSGCAACRTPTIFREANIISQREKEQTRRRASAYSTALAILRERHREEFQAIYDEVRCTTQDKGEQR